MFSPTVFLPYPFFNGMSNLLFGLFDQNACEPPLSIWQVFHGAFSFSIVHKTRDIQPGTDLWASQPSSSLGPSVLPISKNITTALHLYKGRDLRWGGEPMRRADGSGNRVPSAILVEGT